MSWFTDLAGKAENILNRLDQNAAMAFQNANGLVEETSLVGVSCGETNNMHALQQPNPLANTIPKRSNEILTSSSTWPKLGTPTKQNVNYFTVSDQLLEGAFLKHIRSQPDEVLIETELNTNKHKQTGLSNLARLEQKEQSITGMEATTLELNRCGQEMLSKAEISVGTNKTVELYVDADDGIDMTTETHKIGKRMSVQKIKSHKNEDGDGLNNLTIERDALKEKLVNLEEREKNGNRKVAELLSRISALEQNERDLKQKLHFSEREAKHAALELQQYRTRAQSTLQLKEQLINNLKNSSVTQDDSENSRTSIELVEIRQERDLALAECKSLNSRIDTLLSEMKLLQITLDASQQESAGSQQTLRDRILQEMEKNQKLEDDVKACAQELQNAKNDLVSKISHYNKVIADRDTELNNLRMKLSKNKSTPSGDLEDRIQTLTQSLVLKQNTLEMLTADRNALRLQLEKSENKQRSTMLELQQSQQSMCLNDTDDAKAQVPNFFMETPFDTRVARKVKRVYSSLDSMGIQTGVFLRRYPMMRILVICYMFFLHLWVVLILFAKL